MVVHVRLLLSRVPILIASSAGREGHYWRVGWAVVAMGASCRMR